MKPIRGQQCANFQAIGIPVTSVPGESHQEAIWHSHLTPARAQAAGPIPRHYLCILCLNISFFLFKPPTSRFAILKFIPSMDLKLWFNKMLQIDHQHTWQLCFSDYSLPPVQEVSLTSPPPPQHLPHRHAHSSPVCSSPTWWRNASSLNSSIFLSFQLQYIKLYASCAILLFREAVPSSF